MTLPPALLPSGVRDELPPFASQKLTATRQLLDFFRGYGYELVRPPLVEYQSPQTPKGALQAVDPQSNTLLALRTDMTPAVARIAATRLHTQPRPLRLCYTGEVFSTHHVPLDPRRQRTQTGLELIGCEAVSADAEMILLAGQSLRRLGLTALNIDLCLPTLFPLLLAVYPLSETEEETASSVLRSRNLQPAATLPPPWQGWLRQMLSVQGELTTAIEKLTFSSWPDAVHPHLQNLQKLAALLPVQDGVAYTIDLAERVGFDYHTGVCFSVFTPHSTREIGRGGRYLLPQNEETATGFTLYVEDVISLVEHPLPPPRVLVPFGQTLPKDVGGYTVFWHGVEPITNSIALEQGCKGWVKDETIVWL